MDLRVSLMRASMLCCLSLLVCAKGRELQRQPLIEHDPAVRARPVFEFSDGAAALLKATESRCMEDAVAELKGKCSSLRADGDEKARLALRTANCFFEHTGRRTYPCPAQTPVRACIGALSAEAYGVYSSFFLQADALCFRVRERAFQETSAEAINGLYEATHQSAATVKQVLRQSAKMGESLGAMQESLTANFGELSRRAAAATELARETNTLSRSAADALGEIRERQSSIKESLLTMES